MSEIKVKIIADSIGFHSKKRITTFELEYPRFIHSELMTHRLFSRNAMSSRAVPVAKMIEQVRTSPAQPCHWGKNQPGMQAKEELVGESLENVQREWHTASASAVYHAKLLNEQGAHKQIVNRTLEPFQMMKTVLTATEFDNFFWLRKHPDAQPEIKELAEKMFEAMEVGACMTQELDVGDWHTPYYEAGYWFKGESPHSLEDALAISSSCCAQVSYRLLDDSLEKARDIFSKLVESKPVHASPFEHQATPMQQGGEFWDESGEYSLNCPSSADCWEAGITHSDRQGDLWSGNFRAWIQHRQLIEDNVCWKYEE